MSEQESTPTAPAVEHDGPETADADSPAKVASHDPAVPEAYLAFMRTGWDDREREVAPHPAAERMAQRRRALAEAFPGERLVLPGGGYRVRARLPLEDPS